MINFKYLNWNEDVYDLSAMENYRLRNLFESFHESIRSQIDKLDSIGCKTGDATIVIICGDNSYNIEVADSCCAQFTSQILPYIENVMQNRTELVKK